MGRTVVVLAASSLVWACQTRPVGGDGGDGTGIGPGAGGGTGESSDAGTDGEGTSGPGNTGGGDSGSGSEMDCGESNFQVDSIPPNVLMVLDKSGSMVKNLWDADNDMGTPDVTRWESLHNVVEFVVWSFEEKINFGAVLFPSAEATATYGAGACRVESEPEVPVEPLNADAVLDGIPPADAVDEIQGATPATKGIETAVAALEDLDPTVDRHMILVTDGAANCHGATSAELMENYDVTLPDTVAAAAADGIHTYVVGIDIVDQVVGVGTDGNPEANPFLELNKVATAGGVPRPGPEKFYNVANEIELRDALEAIAGDLISCVIPLEMEPPKPHLVEIRIGGVVVPKIDDCQSEDGWTYLNPGGPYDVIELCGTACDLIAEHGTLDAKFGCPKPG